MNHTDFMNMALDLAKEGRGYTSPNPMVGAVVVRDGKIVGKGYHRAVGGPHAEVNALVDAGSSARGAVLYVTLEPCNHTGRTPPCTERIIDAGIRKVMIAMDDPNPNVRGGGKKYLENHGIETTTGLCKESAEKLNEAFIKHIETKHPFVTAKCAATLDGRIATKTGDSKWITGEKSRAFVHQLRQASDAILIGIDTVINDDPSLTTRLESGTGSDPKRIILDTQLKISKTARVLNLDSKAETIIITGPTPPEKKRLSIEKTNVRIIPLKSENSLINMNSLARYLGESNIMSLLIEGGSRVLASAFKAKIVDKIFFFYAPKILGGDDGVPICRGPGFSLMNESIQVKNIHVRRFDDDVMIEGYI